MRNVMLKATAAAVLFGSQVAAAEQPEVPLLFLADPQVHNAYGTSLKQMFPVSDWVAKVAIRPPEVNLLAPLTLRHALAKGQDALAGSGRLAVVLGDGTNIGCSGEADAFDAEFANARPGLVRLMAHGNHDSYMMGTINSYGPKGPNTWTPGRMMTADLPVDEAWWNPTGSPERTGTSALGRNWMDACYRPAVGEGAAAGTPMNKVRWLARYASSLAPHGLVQANVGTADHEGLVFSGQGAPGSVLAAMNYRSRGVWFRPRPETPTRGEDYARSWNSFVVQAVDFGERHTLVLIDTSVCQNARGGVRFLTSNAGTHACIGKAQFKAIEELMDGVDADRHVVFAGHFPIKDLKRRERRRLAAIMRNHSPSGWTYVSGHTHAALSETAYSGGVDRNIGSTTDWPMESHVFRFDAASAQVVSRSSTVLKDDVVPLDYSLSWDLAGRYSELCRHLPAARALAGARPAVYGTPWVSPVMDEEVCRDIQAKWADNAAALIGHQATISARFDEDPQYRDFILRLAVGASRFEDGQRRIGPRRIP